MLSFTLCLTLIYDCRMARKSRLSKSRSSKSRPAKMGRKWTQDDFLAYNIKVAYQDLQTFFGIKDLPSPDVESDALTAQDVNTAARWTSSMLFHMDRVAEPDETGRKSSTIDFVKAVFNVLNYPDALQRRFLLAWLKLDYLASQGRRPQVDVCISDDTFAILLLAKVDMHLRGFDPEPRLISDAIAAFHNDNIRRATYLRTDPLTSKVMPGIVVDETMPTFYKIPITSELVKAVESGERPEEETIVHAYRPEVPRPEEGIRPLDNRFIILSCFEAFRRFM
jgi:hypothetical protein